MITIQCVLDNSVLRGSKLWGEHGVSFLIETPAGRILFDTGQSGDVLVHNADLMGIDLSRIDALVISHAHYDHTGGLERVLTLCKPGIPLFANPDLFRDRFSGKDPQARSIGLEYSLEQLSRYVDLRLGVEPVEIVPGIWTTGVITDRSEFEGRSPSHFIRENGEWLPDPYLDDLSLILEARDGLVVVCGCCHAGLLNTLAHIRRTFAKPITAVIGGTHLTSATQEDLDHAIDVLRGDGQGMAIDLYPNHCTGERAYYALAQAFGDRVRPCPAGTMLNFDDFHAAPESGG